MKIESISFDELSDGDRSAWRSVLSQHSLPNPLNDPDYLQCLSDVGRKIGVIRVLDNERPIVFWPFETSGHRRLQPAALPLSDCSQLLIAQDVAINPGTILNEAGFQSYDFDHLFHQSSFDAAAYSYYEDACYLIRLDRGFDSYLASFSERGSKLVSQARSKKKKLEKTLGPVRFEADSSDPRHLRTMLDWKVEQLTRQGMSHCFCDDWAVNFMQEHLNKDSEYCQGKLSVLYAGGAIVAMHFGTWGYGSINSWLPSINPEFSRLSPALNLYLELSKFAVENDIQTIILGRGENQTKTRLANDTVPNFVGRIQTGIIGKTRNWGMKRLYGLARSEWGKYIREKARGIRN